MPLKTAILDIETVPNEAAIDRLSEMRQPIETEAGWPKWILQRIVAASVLSVEDNVDAPHFELCSWHLGQMREEAIIAEVERTLQDAHVLVTFNGRAHDLPILRARAMAARSLAVPRIAGFRLPKSSRHVDLADELCGRGCARPSLGETAALLGLPAKTVLGSETVPGLAAAGDFSRIARHCETDVVATWLAHLHLAMTDAGSDQSFVSGAQGLAEWLCDKGAGRPHLSIFIEACQRMARFEATDPLPLRDPSELAF